MKDSRPQNADPRHSPGGVAELWLLAYPIIIATISQTIMGVVDTWFMGRIGTVEQGAVGFASITFWTLLSLFAGTLQGVATFAAQHYGAGHYPRCGRDGWLGLYVAAPSALVLAGIALISPRLIGAILPDPNLVKPAGAYLSVRLCGSLFVLINYAVVNFLRGIGDTRTPMYFAIGANLLNILLDYALILGNLGAPRMGAQGAALGSVISTAVFSAAFLVFFLTGERRRRFETGRVRPATLREIIAFLKVGVPIGGGWVLEMVCWTFFTWFISRLGPVQLAATIIVFEVLHFSFMVAVALGTAATTLVGQYLGADDIPNATRCARSTLCSGVLYCVIVGLIFLGFRRFIMELFSLDPEVVEVGCRIFIYVAVFQIFDGLGISCNGVIRGAGDTRWPMILTVLLAWGLFLPLTYCLTEVVDGGIDGAWIAATLFLAAMGSCLYLRLRSGKWKTMRV